VSTEAMMLKMKYPIFSNNVLGNMVILFREVGEPDNIMYNDHSERFQYVSIWYDSIVFQYREDNRYNDDDMIYTHSGLGEYCYFWDALESFKELRCQLKQ